MKKNLEFEEEYLTEEMIATFYPQQGDVINKKSYIKERSITKVTPNNRRMSSFGLKTMYSIN